MRPLRTLCLLSLLGAAAFISGCSTERAPNVILVTADTLRADALGAYGGGAALPTPHLDRLARDGARFDSTFAPTPRTTQAVGTLLTGLHPLTHGADGLGMSLREEVTTLAELFSDAGYDTAAFTTNVNLASGRGFEQGFDLYSNPEARWRSNSAPSLTREALAWIDDRGAEPDRPFFLWIHYLDPHWTYEPAGSLVRQIDPGYTPPFDLFEEQRKGSFTKGQIIFEADRLMDERMIEHVRRLYQAEIHATDAAVGELLSGLDARGSSEDAIVAFTVDHGESLGDHRYWFAHGEYLYEDTLHVPFLVRAPERVPAGTEIAGPSRLADVAPTLAGLAGLEFPGEVEGSDLSGQLRAGGRHELADRPMLHVGDFLLIHSENPRQELEGRAGRWLAYREAGYKLIRIPREDGSFDEELYDLRVDPEEAQDIAASEPERVAAMRAALLERAASYGPPSGEPIEAPDEETMDALRSLGYVN